MDLGDEHICTTAQPGLWHLCAWRRAMFRARGAAQRRLCRAKNTGESRQAPCAFGIGPIIGRSSEWWRGVAGGAAPPKGLLGGNIGLAGNGIGPRVGWLKGLPIPAD